MGLHNSIPLLCSSETGQADGCAVLPAVPAERSEPGGEIRLSLAASPSSGLLRYLAPWAISWRKEPRAYWLHRLWGLSLEFSILGT